MERQLKEKYGIWYWIHNFLSVVIIFIPFVIFLSLVPSPAFEPELPFVIGAIIGILGSFSIGLGLVNIFMILIKQYLGHIVTLAALSIGIVLDAAVLIFYYFAI